LTLHNKGIETLRDFAIAFNANSFGLVLAKPINIQSALLPMQSIDTLVFMKSEGQAKPCHPFNSMFIWRGWHFFYFSNYNALCCKLDLQVALKSSGGIVYFQTLMPLHTLFTPKGKVAQDVWLRMWQTDIPSSNEISTHFENLNVGSVERVSSRFASNHVYIVADRVVDGMVSI
jgi:hypothetical protein